MKARELATGKWRAILPMLGIPADYLDGKHHACPNGQGRDRFRFADRNGSGNYFCACSNGDKGGIGMVMCCRSMSYPEAARAVESVVGNAKSCSPKPHRDPRIALNTLRKFMRPVGFGVTRYLQERGLKSAPGLLEARLHYWHEGKDLGIYTTMAAVITGGNGSRQSYHLTYLDGVAKANVPCPRKVMTPVETITGGAVRLYPCAAKMGVAEGIETAIAAHMLTGMPVWAAVSAHGVESFVPPEGTKALAIFADTDDSFTGQAAAYACAKRVRNLGIECSVRLPDRGDWNDALRSQKQVTSIPSTNSK